MVSNERVIAIIFNYLLSLAIGVHHRATGLLPMGWVGIVCAQKQYLSKGADRMWKKGQSGNPAGRKRKRGFDDYLREALSAKRGAAAKRLVERLIGEAATGNVQALKLVD
jgi:hypothetical protein